MEQMAVRMEKMEERQERLEERTDKLEEVVQRQQIEFAETRVYVKETYKRLDDIALSIESLKNSTNDRIDATLRLLREDKKDDGGAAEKKQVYDFAKYVIGGILALATAILAVVQFYAKMGGGQ